MICWWCNEPGHPSFHCKKKARGDDPHPDGAEARRRRENASSGGRRDGNSNSRPGVQLVVTPARFGMIRAESVRRTQYAGRSVADMTPLPMAQVASVSLKSHILFWQPLMGMPKDMLPWLRAAFDNGAQVSMITHDAVERFAGHLKVDKQAWILAGLGDGRVETDRIVNLPLLYGDTVMYTPAVVIGKDHMPLPDTELLIGLDVIQEMCSFVSARKGPKIGVHVQPSLHGKTTSVVLRGEAVQDYYHKPDTAQPPWKYDCHMAKLDSRLVKFRIDVPKPIFETPGKSASLRASGGDTGSVPSASLRASGGDTSSVPSPAPRPRPRPRSERSPLAGRCCSWLSLPAACARVLRGNPDSGPATWIFMR